MEHVGLRRDGVRDRSLNSPGYAHFSEHSGPSIGRATDLRYGSFRGDKSVGFLARGSAGRSDTGEGGYGPLGFRLLSMAFAGAVICLVLWRLQHHEHR